MEQKPKNLRSAFFSACSVMFVLALVLGTMFATSGCADELANPRETPTDTITVIKDWYWLSERTGIATTSVNDTLVSSVATFDQTSSLYYQQENVRVKFNPQAYLNVRLSKSRIEARSADELPVTLVKTYIKSRTPYKNQTMYGEDVVKVFEYSDGQVATVSFGYRYTGVVVGLDTLAVPHVEIDDVSYTRQAVDANGEKTETETPYKSTLMFNAVYSIKGTSSSETSSSVTLRPWYHKVITTDPMKVLNVTYNGKYVNCPVDAYELVEMVKTNKGEFSNTYRVNLSMKMIAPQPSEQPSLDSLFNKTSTPKFNEQVFSKIKNEDGFTIQTITGSYVSTNVGKEARTYVESLVQFTYQYPVKFESEYGSYTIEPLKLSFEELGFEVKKLSSNDKFNRFRTTNLVEGTLGTCTLNLIEEIVDLNIPKDKKPDVVRVDSVYTLKGNGDDYIVDKIVIWSDGSKDETSYDYKGRHSATAEAFGNKITSSLNWGENALQRVSQSKENDEKKFSDTTKFSVVYTTSKWRSDATNGVESGVFAFEETTPVVTFIDGEVTKVFPERKYSLVGLGADVATDYTIMVMNKTSYKAYAYDYVTKVEWNGEAEPDLVSAGYLLMPADETGQPRYTVNQTWNGNTTTVKVTKTTPHSFADDEVVNYTKNFTISLNGLTDGKVYADNTSFKAEVGTYSETSSDATDGSWKVVTYRRTYPYTITNGEVSRNDLKALVTDAEITFDDGSFNHTFDVRLAVGKSEEFGQSRSVGDYLVTPHLLTVTGNTVDGRQVSATASTDIYVKQDKTGDPVYTTSQTWNGNTTTLKVTKTTPHSNAQDEVENFTKNFTIGLSGLTNGKVYAENTNFTVAETHTENSSSATDGPWKVNSFKRNYNYTLSNGAVTRNDLNAEVVDAEILFDNGDYKHTFNVRLNVVKSDAFNASRTEGDYAVTPHVLTVNGTTVDGKRVSSSGTTDIYVKTKNDEPEFPHLGKPKGFTVTASFDPSAQITRRAFVFNWEEGVTYAVCNYETMLPNSGDFMFMESNYKEYNSVGYDKNNTAHWQPARGTDDSDALRWYFADGTLMSAIDKALTCKVIGWKNIVNGQYALIIEGYTYEINGYTITVKAPDGQTVSFNSHYNK